MPLTDIEWTDRAWPVVNGCRRVSPGCENCWAERLTATRLRHHPRYKGLAVYTENGPRWTGERRLAIDILDEPLRTKKPQRWFVANKGDLFSEEVTDEQIAAVFGVMAACPQHTFQVLTKRAERMVRWFKWHREQRIRRFDFSGSEWRICEDEAMEHLPDLPAIGSRALWPLRNVWIGVSVEDQQRADERIPHLMRCPAAVRFLSVEPMIGPVDLSQWLTSEAWWCPHCKAGVELGEVAWHGFNNPASDAYCPTCDTVLDAACGPSLQWVIVGGESGPGARPCHVEWIRSIVRQCRAAAVPVFVKQLISDSDNDRRFAGDMTLPHPFRIHLSDRKGGDPSEWPEDLRVREFPEATP